MLVRPVHWLFVALALASSIGCGDSPGAGPEHDSFRGVAALYRRYMAEHEGRRPPNEAEFREFIAKDGAAVLKALGISSADALFVSVRDGQPIQIVYAAEAAKHPRVIAYERIGADGKRMIADTLGAVGLADETEFNAALGSH